VNEKLKAVFGESDEGALRQIRDCLADKLAVAGALMAGEDVFDPTRTSGAYVRGDALPNGEVPRLRPTRRSSTSGAEERGRERPVRRGCGVLRLEAER